MISTFPQAYTALNRGLLDFNSKVPGTARRPIPRVLGAFPFLSSCLLLPPPASPAPTAAAAVATPARGCCVWAS